MNGITYFDKVKKRAQEIYNTRVQLGIKGDSLTDWINAERDVIEEENKERIYNKQNWL